MSGKHAVVTTSLLSLPTRAYIRTPETGGSGILRVYPNWVVPAGDSDDSTRAGYVLASPRRIGTNSRPELSSTGHRGPVVPSASLVGLHSQPNSSLFGAATRLRVKRVAAAFLPNRGLETPTWATALGQGVL